MEASGHEADDDDDVREVTLAGERGADAPPPRWCGGDETSENEGGEACWTADSDSQADPSSLSLQISEPHQVIYKSYSDLTRTEHQGTCGAVIKFNA